MRLSLISDPGQLFYMKGPVPKNEKKNRKDTHSFEAEFHRRWNSIKNILHKLPKNAFFDQVIKKFLVEFESLGNSVSYQRVYLLYFPHFLEQVLC